MLEEPVNVAYMKSVMELTGSRQYNLNGMSVFEVLGSFCARAYDVDDDGVGRICVISSDAVTRGGFLGRRKTGVHKLTLTTDALEHEEKANVPAGLQGLSAFAFPRVIRRIIRHELDLVDIDAVNCHYHLMAMRHDLGIYPALRHYLDQRGDVLGECCSHFRVKKGREGALHPPRLQRVGPPVAPRQRERQPPRPLRSVPEGLPQGAGRAAQGRGEVPPRAVGRALHEA